MTRPLTVDEEFFFHRAAFSVKPGETEEQARANNARDLAAAEEKAAALGWSYEWAEEPDPVLGEDEKPGEYEYMCVLLKDEKGNVLQSLGSVWCGDMEYFRVVEAELASEALHEIANRPPYCKPAQSGLLSTERAVAARLSRLLNALSDEINDNVVQGKITDDIRALRMKIHTTIVAEGWRIKALDRPSRWKVLPPVTERNKRKEK